jgi:hypothetical protein
MFLPNNIWFFSASRMKDIRGRGDVDENEKLGKVLTDLKKVHGIRELNFLN